MTLLFSAILLLDQASASEVISRTFNPSADSWIGAFLPDMNHGTETGFNLNPCDNLPDPYRCKLNEDNRKRILVNFSILTIPAGSSVTSATLYLYLYSVFGGSLIQEVHRVTNSWIETEVTWNKRNAAYLWSNPGGDGDFDSTSTDSPTITNITNEWKSWTVTNDVRYFVNGTYTNYGWIILKDGGYDGDFIYISRESSDTTLRPKLVVSFSAPWESYNNSDRTSQTDVFANNDHVVYMKGTGFENGYYNVAYYDNTGNKIKSDSNINVNNGIINSSYTLTDDQTAKSGTWHAIAQPASGYTAFPDAYSTAIGSPDTYGLIANRAFTVQQSAVSEFPAGIILPFAASVIMYTCMRNRIKNGKK